MKNIDSNRNKTYKHKNDPEVKQEAPNLGFAILIFIVFISAYIYFSNFYFV